MVIFKIYCRLIWISKVFPPLPRGAAPLATSPSLARLFHSLIVVEYLLTDFNPEFKLIFAGRDSAGKNMASRAFCLCSLPPRIGHSKLFWARWSTVLWARLPPPLLSAMRLLQWTDPRCNLKLLNFKSRTPLDCNWPFIVNLVRPLVFPRNSKHHVQFVYLTALYLVYNRVYNIDESCGGQLQSWRKRFWVVFIDFKCPPTLIHPLLLLLLLLWAWIHSLVSNGWPHGWATPVTMEQLWPAFFPILFSYTQ